jgi:hypothetical protein
MARFGMPSSVLRDPKDGMFYAMLLTNWGRGLAVGESVIVKF